MKHIKLIIVIILVIPLFLSVIIPSLEAMAGLSYYSRWLFDGVIFPIIDWMQGSYLKALLVWLGSAVCFMGWVSTLTWGTYDLYE